MRGHCVLACVLTVAACSTTPAARAADKTPPAVEIGLTLHGALFQGEKPAPGGPSLLVDLRRTGDRWERVWGIARNFNVAMHTGRVAEGDVAEGAIELALEMKINGDAWVPGGRASYRVKLRKTDGEKYEGTYTGRFKGVTFNGGAEARRKPPRRTVVEGYVPLQPGEHPRILFREHDLPRLKEKARTPFGRAAIEKLVGPVGLGVKYQLTGEKKYAVQAIPEVEKLIARGLATDQFGHNVGDRAQQVAIAYDCCYDAWPEAVKSRVESYLAWSANVIFFDQAQLSGGINWHVCSNWSAPVYTGAAFAGLALWGEKGPAPPEPVEPAAAREIPPAGDYTPGKGVPVVPLVPGFCADKWLAIPPLDFVVDGDPLEPLGGAADCRPEPGTKLTVGPRELSFAPLDSQNLLAVGRGGINLRKVMEDSSSITCCYYTVLKNDEPRLVKVRNPFGRAGKPEMYLSGRLVPHEQLLKLDKGLYPMMVALKLSAKWESLVACLDEATEDDLAAARAALPERMADYEQAHKDWQLDLDEWKRLGGANVQYLKLFEMGRKMMVLHYREAVGTGGFQAEVGGYSAIATAAPATYAPAYRTMFGEDASPYADISHYVPRKMFAHVYADDGGMTAQDVNGTPKVDDGNFAILFPVTPDEWKPAVLWGWHRHAGVGDDGPLEGLLDPSAGHAKWLSVYAFLHYPLGMKPKHPQGILPLTWEAPDFGYYGFRDTWRGGYAFVAQVFLKAHFIGGWNGPNAGTFRLMGLGDVWAHGPTDRNRSRWEENVVQLPENPEINLGALGRATFVETEKDGSGVVSMDLGDVYATTEIDNKGRRARLYEAYGNIRVPGSFRDSGITGMRSVGVDYSGKSGAPCLFVVVDKIAGAKSKVWTWQVDKAAKRRKSDPSALDYTTVEGNTFTVARPDGATLRGTFVAPEAVKLEAGVRQTSMTGGAGSSRGKTLEKPIHGVFATGGGEFFCIVTVGPGDPPEVKTQGRGLDARVTVGGQTVRFDGEKIIFGK